MSAPCDLAEDFFDGELPPAQADEYRRHAANCETCRKELGVLAQLRALEVQYRPEVEARVQDAAARAQDRARSRRAFRTRWAFAAAGALGAVAATLLLWLGWSRFAEQVPEKAFYPAVTLRLAEGRSAHPRAAEHRPLAQGVLGSEGRSARSYDALGALERSGDVLGVASAHLARGTAADAEEALAALEDVPPSADALSELSFAHLVRNDSAQGDAEEALRLADQALERSPRHGPALWNRALALRVLGLGLMSARTFDQVAAQGERGWSDEARARAQEQRAGVDAVRRTWLAAIEAGKELVATGAQPSQELLGVPVLRHYFYDAVRSRTSTEEVERLRPLAREMDARAGDGALEAYVSSVASRGFAERAPLAAEYRRLALGEPGVDGAGLVQRLRRANQPDLLLGALAKLDQVERRPEELAQLGRAVGSDSWLSTLAMELRADALQRARKTAEARAALEEEIGACLQARIDYRCAEAEFELASMLDADPSQLEQATAHARRGWSAALRAQAWNRQGQLVLELAQLARHRGDVSISRAYYEEDLERDGGAEPERERYAHEGLASLDVQALRIDEARRHIDAALKTGRPLDLTGALALSDVARLRPSPADAAAMEAFRTRLPELQPGPRALAEHALGRWEIERDRQKGEQLLRAAIRHATDAGLATADPKARRALAYSYTSLLFDAGKRGDAEGALRIFEEEWLAGAPGALPSRCLLAMAYDAPERLLAVVRGAAGGPATAFSESGRNQPLPGNLSGVLPPAALERLTGCPKVDVLARAPLYGRPGLLPRDVAWSYRGPVSQEAAAPSGPRRHLVVQEVTLSPGRRPLKTPPRWKVPEVPGEPVEELGRQEATPRVALRRMESATDITLIVHALVQPESEEAYLVMAPDGQAGDALHASDIQRAQLRGHPLVVLASCKGAHPAPVLHEARSLPAAFLEAGARAVLAASDNVPERDGPEFFAAVRARVSAGTAPAEALRAERAAWVARGRGAQWLDGVLLFE